MNFGSRKELVSRIIESKEYRDAYVWAYLRRHLPFQVRTMRTERDWSQEVAGEKLGKPQSVISRLESPEYGKVTLQTLVETAKGYDVGLIVKFVPFSQLLREYEDVSFEALGVASPTEKYKEEIEALNEWAEENDSGFWEEESSKVVLTTDRFPDKPVEQPRKHLFASGYAREDKNLANVRPLVRNTDEPFVETSNTRTSRETAISNTPKDTTKLFIGGSTPPAKRLA